MNESILGTLVLENNEIFSGELVGALKPYTSGEIVFNTSLSGYQEIITDPSYAGQIITFTYTHIGNYGTNDSDNEASKPFCRGIIARDITDLPSNFRSQRSLNEFLIVNGLSGIIGIDTRRLTRLIRKKGAMTGAFGTLAAEELLAHARNEVGTTNVDLVKEVTTQAPYVVGGTGPKIVAYDFGIKRTILTHLKSRFNVTVVPSTSEADDVLNGEFTEGRPDGIFLSNGPGDPAALNMIVENVDRLVGKIPMFGICLGHQILGRVFGADTIKLPFGHHGGNHPVKRLADGFVEITSQNHSYAVDEGSLKKIKVTHRNLNDGVVEGISALGDKVFSVQYHPEAGPGPHDATYLFDQFYQLVKENI
jgi:carbamoyl-phosphate synthase small subunit